MKLRVPAALKWIISLAALAWVGMQFADQDFGDISLTLKSIRWNYFWLAVALAILTYALRIWRLARWSAMAGGTPYKWRLWTDLYLKSVALGSVTPARLGDFSRVALLKDTGISLSVRARIVIQEKLSDLVYLPLAFFVSAGIASTKFDVSTNLLMLIGVGLLIGYLVVTLVNGRIITLRGILLGWFIGVIGFIPFVVSNMFLFWSVDVEFGFAEVAAIVVVTGVLANLPISIGGIGVREGSLLVLLTSWGLSREAAIPVIFLEFCLNIIYPVVLFAIWRLVAGRQVSA